jgi:hypothetical protein
MNLQPLLSLWRCRAPHGRRCAFVLALVAAVWLGGCGSSGGSGNHDVVTPPPGVGVVYVSGASGTPQGQGTLVDPLQSIQAAINAAAATYDQAWVLVETGAYPVPFDQGQAIVLAEGISLYGGYAPGFMARDPVTYSSNLYDSSTTDGSVGVPDRALTAGAAISALTIVDGLGIFGQGTGSAAAVYVEGGSPTIQDCVISATNAGALNSYGILINGGSPRILDNEINGGKGTTSAYGIDAVRNTSLALDAEPEIRGNRINPETWVGYGTNSYGVWLSSATSPSVSYNAISGGYAQGVATGVEIYSVNGALIEHNQIDGGTIVAGTGSKVTHGILVAASSAAPIIRYNDISGGTAGVESHGIRVQNTSALFLITSNTIAGGGGSTSYGIRNYAGTQPWITLNTVDGGEGNTSYGIYSTGSGTSPFIHSNTVNAGSPWAQSTAYGIYNNSTNVAYGISNNDIRAVNGIATYGIYNSASAPSISSNRIDAASTGIFNANSDPALTNNQIYGAVVAIDLQSGSNPAISGGGLWGRTCIVEEDASSDPTSINGVAVGCTYSYYRDNDSGLEFYSGVLCSSAEDGLTHAGDNFCTPVTVGGNAVLVGLATPIASNITFTDILPPWQ